MTTHHPLPDPVDSRRATAGGMVRTAYALAVGGLALVLLWLAVKPLVYTQTPGRVVAPAYIVSTPYNSRVLAVYAAPGARIRAGDRIAKVRSPEVQALMATLAAALAEQVNVLAELRIRLTVAEASVPSARQRAQISAYNVSRLGGLSCESTATFCSDIYRENALATGALAQIEAEITELRAQLERVEQARRTVADLRDSVIAGFQSGEQISPVDGVVGPEIAHPGQSVTAGDTIATILDDSAAQIEWVLDGSRIRQPRQGDPVYIIDGNHVMRGSVSSVLSIAGISSQTTSIFRGPAQGQVVRVSLDETEDYPPVLTDVEVRYNYWRSLDGAVELYVRMMEVTGLWRDH